MDVQISSFDRPELLADPYPLYRRLHREAPIRWDTAEDAWLVTRYADVVSLLRNPTLSARADVSFIDQLPISVRREAEALRRHFESWMVFSDPPLHTKLRNLTHRHLSPNSVPALRPLLEELAGRLLEDAERQGTIDALNGYSLPLARLALAEIFGINESQLSQAAKWSDELLEFINTEPSVKQTRRSLASLNELTEFVHGLRTASLRTGSLGHILIQAYTDGQLTETELIATFAQNITGSLGPIPQVISNGILALCAHPAELRRLQSNQSLIRSAIEEFLRFDPPFLLVPRTATQTLRIRSIEIQPGQRIGLMLGAANHDPEIFVAPECLDVARQPNPHLAFGIGSHYCLGAYLTRLVAEVAILSLVSRFSSIEVAHSVERLVLFGMRGVRSLPLRVERAGNRKGGRSI